MPVDPAVVGCRLPACDYTYTQDDALLYNLAVGAPATDLRLVYENADLAVLPTFAVVPAFPALGGIGSVITFNPMLLLHGEQRIEIHRPIPTAATVRTEPTVKHLWDKGKAAVVVIEAVSTILGGDADGAAAFTNTSTLFLRGEGGFGGERGPSGARNVAPERAADHVVRDTTLAQQAALYRLCGDRNPLHIDPEFAAFAGFERPILHGLCTFGFVGRAAVTVLCDGDPTRLRAFEGRFAASVYPGDDIVTSIWREEENRAVLTAATNGGKVVLEQAAVEFV